MSYYTAECWEDEARACEHCGWVGPDQWLDATAADPCPNCGKDGCWIQTYSVAESRWFYMDPSSNLPVGPFDSDVDALEEMKAKGLL